MVANIKFPIGSPLIAISVIEDKEFDSDELCLDQVQLFFEDTIIMLRPVVDTDEIEITQSSNSSSLESLNNPPEWSRLLLGKTLETVWICKNTQNYEDQIILAFDFLQPTIAFLAEGSVLKAFWYKQVMRKESKPEKWAIQQLVPAIHN